MKYNLIYLIFIVLLTFTSCNDESTQSLFSQVTFRAELPDGRKIVRMEVDKTLPSTYLRNLNSYTNYEFPLFVNNQGTTRLQKGIYLISFDAIATFEDGTTARVRSSQYSNAENALPLLNDNENIPLILYLIN